MFIKRGKLAAACTYNTALTVIASSGKEFGFAVEGTKRQVTDKKLPCRQLIRFFVMFASPSLTGIRPSELREQVKSWALNATAHKGQKTTLGISMIEAASFAQDVEVSVTMQEIVGKDWISASERIGDPHL